MSITRLIGPLLVMAVGWACSQNIDPPPSGLKESSTMADNKLQHPMPAVPPIDEEAMTAFETATFGLG